MVDKIKYLDRLYWLNGVMLAAFFLALFYNSNRNASVYSILTAIAIPLVFNLFKSGMFNYSWLDSSTIYKEMISPSERTYARLYIRMVGSSTGFFAGLCIVLAYQDMTRIGRMLVLGVLGLLIINAIPEHSLKNKGGFFLLTALSLFAILFVILATSGVTPAVR